MTISNKIEGTIRLISPMHCATIDASSDATGNENITRTHKQTVITSRGSQRMPFFPANDLRGRLRRKAAAIVLDQITATSKVKVDLYAALMAGAITASPESDLTIEEALRARDNVYMGLFGGGTRLLRSRYCTNDLMPIVQDTIDAGIVPASFGDNGVPQGFAGDGTTGPLTGFHLVQTRTSFRIDDVARVINADEIEKYVENAVNSIAVKQAQTLADRAERKADKAAVKAGDLKAEAMAGKKDLSNMFAVEVVPRGTPLHCLIDLQNDTSDAHVGLLLMALTALVREQGLGGWIRAGFGRFSADLTLTRNGQKYKIFVDGQNSADATLTPEVDAAFCNPARAAIAALTAESMMEFFTPRAAEKEEKPAKGKKATAEVAA
jgi:CRISPR type IV-associated protein Csf2